VEDILFSEPPSFFILNIFFEDPTIVKGVNEKINILTALQKMSKLLLAIKNELKTIQSRFPRS
jgi:hypothetical protein